MNHYMRELDSRWYRFHRLPEERDGCASGGEGTHMTAVRTTDKPDRPRGAPTCSAPTMGTALGELAAIGTGSGESAQPESRLGSLKELGERPASR